jgi:acyl dehydratase
MTTSVSPSTIVAGPYFDELAVGDTASDAPAITITDGHAALHQSIVGDRLRLCLDATLSEQVLGTDRRFVHPSLVCDISIGQSTVLTQRVIGNLFYRGLVLRRPVVVGDTLHTTTRVEALRENRRRPDRAPTGLALLRVTTVDQRERPVLDFWRCAMLPLSDGCAPTSRDDDVMGDAHSFAPSALVEVAGAWRLNAYRAALAVGTPFAALRPPLRWLIETGDVVSSAPELARLTLNVATAHHDARAAGGRRLVYGGHTIGIAASQMCRALPDLVTIIAWEGCDHLNPVYEGDVLRSSIELTHTHRLPDAGGLAHLRAVVQAHREDVDPVDVLDWRLVGLMA